MKALQHAQRTILIATSPDIAIGAVAPLAAAGWHPVVIDPPEVARSVSRRRPVGVVARLTDAELAARLGRILPVVDVSAVLEHSPVPRVCVDCRAGARLQADHLAARGLRRVAAVTTVDAMGRRRRAAFEERARERGLEVLPGFGLAGAPFPTAADSRRLHRWLADLPRPVGLAASGDPLAVPVAHACEELGCGIPTDCALLGMDDAQQWCLALRPALSSVAWPQRRIGHLAAQRLLALLAGEAAPAVTRVPPMALRQRASTALNAIDDPLLRRAVDHLDQPDGPTMAIDELARRIGCGRRALERRFRERLRTSIHAEQERRRLDRAAQLLAEGCDPIARIAEQLGYASQQWFSQRFQARHGIPPGAFRRQQG